LLPIYPFILTETKLDSKSQYDSLFKGGSYVELISVSGVHIRVDSNLPFWQIYTPPDSKRIAIEPMSYCGNVYRIQG
jgi:galactose mutarotase-like enzyme